MVDERTTLRSKSQMVWGSIWVTPGGRVGRSPLVIMDRDYTSPKSGYTAWSYCRALEEGLLPQYKPGERFLQDNAKIHTAKITNEWLESHRIQTVKAPPYSPDLNPIKHMWWALKKKLYKLYPKLNQLGELKEEQCQFYKAL